jgi:hypothetical protein
MEINKDLEGEGRRLFRNIAPIFAWKDSGKLWEPAETQQRFEQGTSKIQVHSVTGTRISPLGKKESRQNSTKEQNNKGKRKEVNAEINKELEKEKY